jgi:hypothetical protein
VNGLKFVPTLAAKPALSTASCAAASAAARTRSAISTAVSASFSPMVVSCSPMLAATPDRPRRAASACACCSLSRCSVRTACVLRAAARRAFWPRDDPSSMPWTARERWMALVWFSSRACASLAALTTGPK